MKKIRHIIRIAAIIIVAVIVVRAANSDDEPKKVESIDASSNAGPGAQGRVGGVNLLAVRGNNDLPHRMLQYKGMDINFNPESHIPNYVAWELNRSMVNGEHKRTNRFYRDDKVKGSASPEDYAYSGYDRGHMAPAGDMKWDYDAMRQSFVMTNIAPQVKKLNTGPWNTLEEKCRLWARVDSAIYIICGPVPNERPIERIGTTGVDVPQRFFKVVISPYASTPRGIGFVMNNGDNPGGLQPTAMSIDQVEAITGYDFFYNLPDDVENAMESQCQFNLWSRLRP